MTLWKSFTRLAAAIVDGLRELGIKVDASVSQGTGHEFLTWRRGLHEFIPHLFKK